jgi:hypothetical protein
VTATYTQVQGIVDGCGAAGYKVSMADMLVQVPNNGYRSLADYYSVYFVSESIHLLASFQNMIAEVGDIQAAINATYRADMDVLKMAREGAPIKDVKAIMEKHSHCSALIRLAPDGSDMFSTHTTWTAYATMLRIYKYYGMNLLGTQGTGIQFSSYPGCVSSIDDYYQISSGLIVIEVSQEAQSAQSCCRVFASEPLSH